MPRHRNKYLLVACTLAITGLMSCQKPTAPQAPAHRSGMIEQPDSTAIQTMAYNTLLAEKASEATKKYVQQDSFHSYEALDGTSWICINLIAGDTIVPRDNEVWHINALINDLSGKALLEIDDQFTIGQNELPTAIDMAIRRMHNGEEAIVVAPWYLAFGASGNDAIGPYTNVVMYINISL